MSFLVSVAAAPETSTAFLSSDQFFTLVGIGVTLIIAVVGAAYKIGRKLKSVEKDVENLKKQTDKIENTIEKHVDKELVNEVKSRITYIERLSMRSSPEVAGGLEESINGDEGVVKSATTREKDDKKK